MSAPALAWWHFEHDIGIREGVERAQRVLSFIFGPSSKRPPDALHDITTDDDKVRLRTDDYQIVVKLLPRGGGRSLIVVIVAGHRGDETGFVMETVRDVMRTGNFNDLLE